ncbi:DUF5597 domain-containing protein [uncultured Bacteroides sp.]|uniref:GH35 family beta-galactosidase n=1 Tax=uncultured Bacteroides sp. TaxID=162156 RepID=UPI00260E337D|nr:DUF5597 domain-containing protein [uncultured Bacteroides sp.]
MIKHLLSIALSLTIFSLHAQELPHWIKQGTASQLVVDKKPMLLLAGELGNSSASSEQDIENVFPKLKRIGLNTVLVPAYWDLIEPEEGKFDFSLIDKTITEARKHDMKVIFLWFGVWKNSMSCYAPLWFKSDYKKYPRCYTETGKPLEIASPFSENVFKADSKAFVKLMNHIKDFDSKENTVIMIQVENEIGMLESARDHSKTANKLFDSAIPDKLKQYLKRNTKTLHPWLKEKWEMAGGKTEGTWEEVFGKDIFTDEIFMAWQYAAYVEKMIQKGREVYNLPMYVNSAMNSRNRKPGEYPSAGPLAHLIDIWKCAAPSIDLLAPDLYDNGFVDWVAQYKLHNNPLFIPEIKLEPNDGVRAFYVFGQHDAIGFSPFSIEDAPDDGNYKLTKAYTKLDELMPLITKYQGKEQMKGILFDQANKEKNIEWDGVTLSCKHFFTLPWDARATDGSVWPEGGGIIIKLNKLEYIVAGSGIVIEFKYPDELKGFIQKKLGEDGFIAAGGNTTDKEKWYSEKRIGIGSVDEVSIDETGNMKYLRRLNGDQDHQGRHVRIGVDDFSILHVKLYEYK